MSNTSIKIEHVSKLYNLGQIGTGTLSHDLNRWWAKVRGNEDPYKKIGVLNDRTKTGSDEFVWALRDISFDVKQGEVLGIVGKNGAGKSTLLKILSRTTLPTEGMIKVKGRIASLLEVGTGFHPDMTGRENVYQNGAILGMTRSEIKRKFDEIVDFAGVAKYIDTPVKRYSSGMYVRLAFAVAAHLEPEILVVDEVLAVGDAEFQKKCLGKMKDVSTNEGRTVLFVSHNMSAVNSLCDRGVLLQSGQLVKQGTAFEVTDYYLKNAVGLNSMKTWDKGGDGVVKPIMLRVIDDIGNPIDFIRVNQRIGFEITYDVLSESAKPRPNFHVLTGNGDTAFVSVEPEILSESVRPGRYKSIMWIPSDFLNEGPYTIGIAISTLNPIIVHFEDYDALNIDVIDDLDAKTRNEYKGKFKGAVRPLLPWETHKIG